jgi:hypothetical protein
MPAQAAVVLAAAEVLDVKLSGRVINHLSQHSRTFKDRLANLQSFRPQVKQHAPKLEARADFGIPVVDSYHIAFARPVLPRTVFKHCVHRSLHPR